MQYVGVASSVGLPVEVPLIVRSLADSLAFIPAGDLPIKIDKDFLAWMGSIPYAHIPEHGMNWWASKAARKLDGHLMQQSTLDLCLEIYRKTHANVRPRIKLTPPAKPLPAARCMTCQEIRVLYVQAAKSLISIKSTAATNRDIMIAHGEMGRRRMAAAYELMELSQMKETLIPPANMSIVAAASSDSMHMAESSVAVDAAHNQPAVQELNIESQWTFGPTLTAQEIIKRLGSISRRGRTWDMRSGKWHSGYFWALPVGKIDEDGYSTTDNSVAAPHASNFSQTSQAAEQEPPPTAYGFPDRFSSKHFRHTPLATVQNKAAAPTPAGPSKPGSMAVFNMFGPARTSTAATVKASRKPEISAPSAITAETVVQGSSSQIQISAPVFQMFGRPTVTQSSGGPAAPHAGGPGATPAGPPVLPAGGPAPLPAVPALTPRLSHALPPSILSGSKPSCVFDMFGKSTAPPASVPAAMVTPKLAPPATAMGAPPAPGVFNMFGHSAAPTAIVPSSVPAVNPPVSRPTQAASTQQAPVFNMFNSQVATDRADPSKAPAPSVMDMYGTHICPSTAQPSPEQLDSAGLYNPPLSGALTVNTPGQPGVFNMFGRPSTGRQVRTTL